MNLINEYTIGYIIGFSLLISFLIYRIIKIWKKDNILKKQIKHEKEFISFMKNKKIISCWE